ncbi:MAG: hypothetical protein ACM3WQ_06355 [Chloroflexota bacterium]
MLDEIAGNSTMDDRPSTELTNDEATIKLRMDVDYAYPSRTKGFIYTALKKKGGKNYLKNSKIIARMINESPMRVRAYWFFTPYTIPDKELLELLTPDKHNVALHIANDPYGELEKLQNATNRKVSFYTIHGTARLLARLIWRRKLWEGRASIPKDFPLRSFYEFPTLGFDRVCYDKPEGPAKQIGHESIARGEILHIHPEWLFQRGTFNHRGPFYEPLRQILQVDKEFDTVFVRKKSFVRIAKYIDMLEYERDTVPDEKFIQKVKERGIDIFSFLERTWCCPIQNPSPIWIKAKDNIALLTLTNYAEWLERVGKKTRNMIRKAQKSGVTLGVAASDSTLAEGIWQIYNETPIRQGRPFPHFGETLQTVQQTLLYRSNDTYIVAYLLGKLIGFIKLAHGDRITIISEILSLQQHSDKAVNNALIAKAVEVCATKQWNTIMYGRMGNHPSLDKFKENNGFNECVITRYYVPLTWKGRIMTILGLHRDLKEKVPQRVKYQLIPIYSWVMRNKLRLGSWLSKQKVGQT